MVFLLTVTGHPQATVGAAAEPREPCETPTQSELPHDVASCRRMIAGNRLRAAVNAAKGRHSG